MRVERASTGQMVLASVLLLLLHFWVRPRLFGTDSQWAPDFLLLAFLLFAMHSGPGAGALAGFLVGLAEDALVPARFGAGLLAHTLVGTVAAWGRSVFFTDNLLVTALFLGAGLWLRDLIVLLASGGGDVLGPLLTAGAPHALVTALTGTLLVLLFRQWFSVRLDL
ncbi:MAG: rod shape-determining protein MreD [Gemmatimonadales bacterium]|nr:rod shape-determining protein MreD [Gemmatimonadales bacterium]